MFPVEIRIRDGGEKAVTAKMNSMREWLDHQRVQPSTFRYTFESGGLVFQVEFKTEAEAMTFAHEFGGRVLFVSARGEAAD
jgi:hypothetical protein